jgi:hypothetical protein
MAIDQDAVFEAHKDVISSIIGDVAYDKDGNVVTPDNTKITAARVELDKLKYKNTRKYAYPTVQEQLDMQYHDAVNGTSTWKDAVAKVKSDNPKG